ncbi:MAG: hypothetical protein FD126_135 [Elusimicrobia bacterium]|nr:MAG: hypothetical protein FD126_135 [Elusimicrobiota bacterium]
MIAALLAVLLAGNAWAVHPPSPKNFTDINNLIAKAKNIEDAIVREEARLRRAEGPIPAPDFEERLKKELEADRNKRDALMQTAINTALVAYGLVLPDAKGNPAMPSGSVQDPVLKRYGFEGSVSWKVTFQDPPPAKRLVAEAFGIGKDRKPALYDGVNHEEYKKYDGSTVGDGFTVLWVKMVDPKTNKQLTPPALARLLHHELKHFELKTTPRVGGPLGSSREEIAAYEADLAALDSFDFSPAEKQVQRDHLTAVRNEYQRTSYLDDTVFKFQSFSARLGGFIKGGYRGETNIESSIPGLYISPDTLNRIRARAGELEKQVLAEQEAREREAAYASGQPPSSGSSGSYSPGAGCGSYSGGLVVPCIPQPSVSPPGGVVAVSPSAQVAQAAQVPASAHAAAAIDRLGLLRDLAVRGCTDPGVMTQGDLDAVWPSLLGLSYSADHASRYGLSGCKQNMFLRLLRMAADYNPNRLTVEVFLAAASASVPYVPSQYIEDDRTAPGSRGPSVPTCRYHPWCQDWKP